MARKKTRSGSHSRRTRAKPNAKRRSLRRWLAWEAVTLGVGATAGLIVAGAWLHLDARQDVRAYTTLDLPCGTSSVWSAPLSVRPGMRATEASLTEDLVAAGYERVASLPSDRAPAASVFRVDEGQFELWTLSDQPGVVEGRASLRLSEGRVVHTSDPEGLRLRPTLLGKVGDLECQRTQVQLAAVPPHVVDALLAMEDVRFYQHRGIDPIGIARGFVTNLMASDRIQGGSTLAQQLAKNLFLTQQRTYRRKVKEAFFATALEQELGKDALLERYLSEVYLGHMAGQPLHGFEQAARAWFGTSLARLELHEAATIVGVIPSPNPTSPARHPNAARERRDLVLRRMLELGRIDRDAFERATSQPLSLAGVPPLRVRLAPYAVDAAVERAEDALGLGTLATQGADIHTTIQPLLQRAADDAVAEGLAEVAARHPPAADAQAALVSLDAEGNIVAMVGGRSYAESAFNRARDARRQAGSTVKALTLLKALDDRIATPATLLSDEPITRTVNGKEWQPRNYDNEHVGELTVRRMIEMSRNVPAIVLSEDVGLRHLQRFFVDAGLSEATALPSAALGAFSVTPLELAGAFTAFAEGVAYRPRLLASVVDADGLLLMSSEPEAFPIVTEQTASQASYVLSGVLESGTGVAAKSYGVHPPAAGKTGTTDDYRDAWFAGMSADLTAVVWVGMDKGTLGLTGSRAALPTWARFMRASGTLDRRRPSPEGLVTASVCPDSGLLARDACEHPYAEIFQEHTAPETSCTVHGSAVERVGSWLGRWLKPNPKRNAVR